MAELYAKRGVVMAADSQSEITTLHLVVSASGDEFRRCLSVTEADDCLVFADVGVLLLCRSDLDLEALGKLEPCALLRDLAVHGLENLAQSMGVRIIDDQEWASMIPSYTHCLTWK